jgi:hypothetical protein
MKLTIWKKKRRYFKPKKYRYGSSGSSELRSCLIGCLSFLGVLVLIAGFIIGLTWLQVHFERKPENRVTLKKDLSEIKKVAIVSFCTYPVLKYGRENALPDEVEYRRDVELLKAICSYHLEIWRIMSKAAPFEIVDLEEVTQNPEYKNIQGKFEILYGILKRNKTEYVSGNEALWIFPILKLKKYSWLIDALNVDAILSVYNEYGFELEPLVQKPKWILVAQSTAFLINRDGKTIWRSLKIRGESSEVQSEGFNFFILESSSIPHEKIIPMFKEAIVNNWIDFSFKLKLDIQESKKR